MLLEDMLQNAAPDGGAEIIVGMAAPLHRESPYISSTVMVSLSRQNLNAEPTCDG